MDARGPKASGPERGAGDAPHGLPGPTWQNGSRGREPELAAWPFRPTEKRGEMMGRSGRWFSSFSFVFLLFQSHFPNLFKTVQITLNLDQNHSSHEIMCTSMNATISC